MQYRALAGIRSSVGRADAGGSRRARGVHHPAPRSRGAGDREHGRRLRRGAHVAHVAPRIVAVHRDHLRGHRDRQGAGGAARARHRDGAGRRIGRRDLGGRRRTALRGGRALPADALRWRCHQDEAPHARLRRVQGGPRPRRRRLARASRRGPRDAGVPTRRRSGPGAARDVSQGRAVAASLRRHERRGGLECGGCGRRARAGAARGAGGVAASSVRVHDGQPAVHTVEAFRSGTAGLGDDLLGLRRRPVDLGRRSQPGAGRHCNVERHQLQHQHRVRRDLRPGNGVLRRDPQRDPKPGRGPAARRQHRHLRRPVRRHPRPVRMLGLARFRRPRLFGHSPV